MTPPAKDYYNLIRTPLSQVEETHTANTLLLVLEDHSFIFRCRVELEEDLEGKIIARKLIQVFFIHPNQIHFGQRFIAGFIIIINGTFNTNALRLPLLTTVGISNSGTTFPLVFSYCPSESEEAFSFFFDSLKEVVFLKGAKFVNSVNTDLPKVIFGDQAAGLISAIPKYLSTTQLQHCD
jgi:hypothetical protein